VAYSCGTSWACATKRAYDTIVGFLPFYTQKYLRESDHVGDQGLILDASISAAISFDIDGAAAASFAHRDLASSHVSPSILGLSAHPPVLLCANTPERTRHPSPGGHVQTPPFRSIPAHPVLLSGA
jgi:hypothetical protein